MPVLNAHASVPLNFPRGAVLTITAPATDFIASFPTLNGVAIAISRVPKRVTLAQGTAYTFTAGNVNITYTTA